jgi:hypothetical protein
VQQQVVTTGSCHLDSKPRSCLTIDVLEVEPVHRHSVGGDHLGPTRLPQSSQNADHFGQIRGDGDLGPRHEGCLTAGALGHHQPTPPGSNRGQHHREYTANRPEGTVETELGDQHPPFGRTSGHHLERGQAGAGKREI